MAAEKASAWKKTADSNVFLHFVDVCLRGAGQVMFQNSAWTGLFFFFGIFWGAYAAHMPAVAWGALLGNVSGTAAAYILKAPREDINIGLHGYNGILVGCALPTFFGPNYLVWVGIIVGSFFATVIMLAVSRFMKTWKVSAMTGPFVFTTWFIMLAAYNFGYFDITGLPHPALTTQPAAASLGHLGFEHFWTGSFTGISQVFLINNVVTGILFLVGLAGSSLWAAVFAWCGSVLAIWTALFLGADSAGVAAGMYQFSAVLTAIGLGSVFYRTGGEVILFTILGTIFTVVAQGALNVLLAPFGIPTLTFPFVISAWIFLLPNIHLLPETHQS